VLLLELADELPEELERIPIPALEMSLSVVRPSFKELSLLEIESLRDIPADRSNLGVHSCLVPLPNANIDSRISVGATRNVVGLFANGCFLLPSLRNHCFVSLFLFLSPSNAQSLHRRTVSYVSSFGLLFSQTISTYFVVPIENESNETMSVTLQS
jgi:hypothetical protein